MAVVGICAATAKGVSYLRKGDYIDDRDTIVKDSVVNRSNIGSESKSKAEELREIKALLDEGIIDASEFLQMKKEILGK